MPNPKYQLSTQPTPELEKILEISGDTRAPRAVVGGVHRNGAVIRLGESQHLDEIASIFIHHPAELDGCLPGRPLRRLVGYVVAVDTMTERTDSDVIGPRRRPARLLYIGLQNQPSSAWVRFIDTPTAWQPLDDAGELEEFTTEMLSELRWYQMRVNNTR